MSVKKTTGIFFFFFLLGLKKSILKTIYFKLKLLYKQVSILILIQVISLYKLVYKFFNKDLYLKNYFLL